MYVLSGDAFSKFEARVLPSDAEQKSLLDEIKLGLDCRILQREQCINRIMANHDTVADLRRRYPNSVISSQADEEGNFKISGVRPATSLMIIAFGRAGANAGMWYYPKMLEAGRDEMVKLSSPSLACLDPDGLARF